MVLNKPEQLWVADITYIKSATKNFYLTIITDAYSKKIMGFNLADNMKTHSFRKALHMAIKNRNILFENLFIIPIEACNFVTNCLLIYWTITISKYQ